MPSLASSSAADPNLTLVLESPPPFDSPRSVCFSGDDIGPQGIDYPFDEIENVSSTAYTAKQPGISSNKLAQVRVPSLQSAYWSADETEDAEGTAGPRTNTVDDSSDARSDKSYEWLLPSSGQLAGDRPRRTIRSPLSTGDSPFRFISPSVRGRASTARPDDSVDSDQSELESVSEFLPTNKGMAGHRRSYAGASSREVQGLKSHHTQLPARSVRPAIPTRPRQVIKSKPAFSTTTPSRRDDMFDIARSTTAVTAVTEPPSSMIIQQLLGTTIGKVKQFRSPMQAAMALDLFKHLQKSVDDTDFYPLVAPPGSGKTLAMVVACTGRILIVAPLNLLKANMLSGLIAQNIHAVVWSVHMQPGHRFKVTICSPGDFGRRDFQSWFKANACDFSCIVIDEIHMWHTDTFRKDCRADQVETLIRVVKPVRIVASTGTLPKHWLSRIGNRFGIESHNIASGFTRPSLPLQHKITVKTIKPDDWHAVRQHISEIRSRLEPTQQILVFCRTKIECETAAEELSEVKGDIVPIWSVDIGATDAESVAIRGAIHRFSSGSDRLAVSTSVLCAGYNFPQLAWVIILGLPDQITETVQMMGRAGRTPATADSAGSTLVFWPSWKKPAPAVALTYDDIVNAARHKTCLRVPFSDYLDNGTFPGDCEKLGAVRCSGCCKDSLYVESRSRSLNTRPSASASVAPPSSSSANPIQFDKISEKVEVERSTCPLDSSRLSFRTQANIKFSSIAASSRQLTKEEIPLLRTSLIELERCNHSVSSRLRNYLEHVEKHCFLDATLTRLETQRKNYEPDPTWHPLIKCDSMQNWFPHPKLKELRKAKNTAKAGSFCRDCFLPLDFAPAHLMGKCRVHGHCDDIFTYVGYILYGETDFVPRGGQLMEGDTDRLDLAFFIDHWLRITPSGLTVILELVLWIAGV